MAFLRKDAVIGRALDLYGEFAESGNRLMMALLRPGDTAIDVGAYVGTVTLALAHAVGPSGRVIAFEPQRMIFQALCTTLTLNGLAEVVAFRAAVGQAAGHVRIPSPDLAVERNFGGISVTQNPAAERVPLVAVDDLRLSACALLKIDAEGMDYDVLIGAANTIARTRPSVYFEGHGGAAVSGVEFFLQRRYQCYWHYAPFYDPASFRLAANVFEGKGDVNVLAVPAEWRLDLPLPPVSAPGAHWKTDYLRFANPSNARA